MTGCDGSLRSLTSQEGYPSQASETAGLIRDRFVKPLRTLKWYDMFTEKKDFSRSKVFSWTNQPARLNSSFARIASFSHCLTEVQDSMASQIKILQNDKGKGKSTGKAHQAIKKLDFLIIFTRSITQAMARTM